jgi:RNA polymerase-binding transcription factor DksA
MDTVRYQAILTARRAELQNRLEKIEIDLDQPRNPDDDDRAIERSNDEVLESLAALGRIAAGTFGACAKCGEPIAEERLQAVPHAALCRDCVNVG